MADSENQQSHDQNFKTIIVENPYAAITFALPLCADYLQHEPEIIPLREETLKVLFSDSFLRTDVPLLAAYKNVAFTFLLEHQHDLYSFSIYQLVRYVSYLQEQYQRMVVPIVFFPYASSRSEVLPKEAESVFMDKRYFYFTYEAVCLKDFAAKQFLDSSNLFARLMLPFMRFAKQEWLEVLDKALTGVLDLVDPIQRLRQSKYLDFLTHYFKLSKKEWEVYRAYKQEKNESEVTDMIGKMFKEEGKTEGLFEGRNLGKAEGLLEGRNLGKAEGLFEGLGLGKVEGKIEEAQKVLLMLLPQKLGPIPPELYATILGLNDVDRIHAILARFMEIKDWQELKQQLH